MDLMRLKAVARLYARGLPPEVGWSDLLQEAFARVLDAGHESGDERISRVLWRDQGPSPPFTPSDPSEFPDVPGAPRRSRNDPPA
jgi:hypothetical protein